MRYNALSLFDGISCGQIALQRAGIEIANYLASEIDTKSIRVTQANWPATIQLGDVRGVHATDLPQVDILLGGSPCQGFSTAGHRRGFDDPRSALFWDFVRLLEECQPHWFLLENVASMSNADRDTITAALGVEPILIDSALVSAGHRRRYYWSNIPNLTQPVDRGITLDDVLEVDPVRVVLPDPWRHRVPPHLPRCPDPQKRVQLLC